MNNEDIKVLEEFINNYKEIQDKYKDDEIQAEIERSCYFEEVPAQAIENLIARNKELEEKNKKLEKFFIKYFDDIDKEFNGLLNHKFIDYIPKSKVKELQDKYKNKIEKLESKKIWNEPVDTINKNRYTNYYNAYEELLQEGDTNETKM